MKYVSAELLTKEVQCSLHAGMFPVLYSIYGSTAYPLKANSTCWILS